jgi:hypothetical protein
MYFAEKRVGISKGSKMTLFVFGDMQMGGTGYRKEIFQDFKQDFLSSPGALGLGLGDYGDFLRPSMRNKIGEQLYQDDEARLQLDDIVRDKIAKLGDEMSFMKGRLIGLNSGHHEWDFRDGTNSTQQLCNQLHTMYLGWSAYSVLKLSNKAKIEEGKAASTVALKIYSTHGDGGSPFSSGDMAQLEKKIAPYWVADMYFRGHSSKGECAPLELNDVNTRGVPTLIKKTRWIVNCPGMMNGYNENSTGYVERKNLPPASLGYVKVSMHYGNFRDFSVDGDVRTGVRIQPMIVSPHIHS